MEVAYSSAVVLLLCSVDKIALVYRMISLTLVDDPSLLSVWFGFAFCF